MLSNKLMIRIRLMLFSTIWSSWIKIVPRILLCCIVVNWSLMFLFRSWLAISRNSIKYLRLMLKCIWWGVCPRRIWEWKLKLRNKIFSFQHFRNTTIKLRTNLKSCSLNLRIKRVCKRQIEHVNFSTLLRLIFILIMMTPCIEK